MSFSTRPFYCEGKHRRASHAIVWGGTRNTLIYTEINRPIIKNITPHLISYTLAKDGFMEIACSCGVLGCGIEFIDDEHVEKGIRFLDVRLYKLPINEWKALYNFKNTGYELSKYKRK